MRLRGRGAAHLCRNTTDDRSGVVKSPTFVLLLLIAWMGSVGCSGELGGGADDVEPEATGGAGGAADDDDVEDGTGGSGGAERPVPQPEQLSPCENGSCWESDAYVGECGFATVEEDFSSGNYNVHRYVSRLWASAETTITVAVGEGGFQPAIIVSAIDGTTLVDGSIGATTDTVSAVVVDDGRDGGVAQVRITTSASLDVAIHVTSWATVDSDFVDFLPQSATYTLDVDSDCSPGAPVDVIAPDGAMAGETDGVVGDNPIALGASWGAPIRFDVPAETHVGFRLSFAPSGASVDMQVLEWDGIAVQEMALTNGGSGERVLAVLDARANRTFWVRARGAVTGASLAAVFTLFVEGPQCQDDCDHMLQLPLPSDPAVDGYDMAGFVVYRYQFGRRDLLMSLRHAGRRVAAQGLAPFTVQDISKADGSQPPGHASHDLGKDVDISVYDAAGAPVWYPLCDEIANECIPGTDHGMDVEAMALKIAPMLESGRVTYIFLDAEFHDALFAAAAALVSAGEISSWLLPYMEDVVTHWPNHNNHIHVRYAID